MTDAGRDQDSARSEAHRVARDGWSRLVAFLAARTRDVAAAEDALSDAFVTALRVWPERGAPTNPEAWLLTAARRNLSHGLRRRNVAARAESEIRRALDEAADLALSALDEPFPDRRLGLLLVCADPAIDPAARTPLMLQVVLGLSAERVASAFLVGGHAMARRLSRAKARIRELGLTFEPPPPEALSPRLGPVLDAVYAAYGAGWDDAARPDKGIDGSLSGEALWLARLIAHLAPAAAEAHGLLALMLFAESRRAARRDPAGRFAPLDAQDRRLWNAEMIGEANAALSTANRAAGSGRFQLEAAIQSLHASAKSTGAPPPPEAVATLYRLLVRIAPSIGATIGCAAALERAGAASEGLAMLDALPDARVASHQPYWAARAHVLAALGRLPDAEDAFTRAAGLTEDAAVRAHLFERRAATSGRAQRSTAREWTDGDEASN